MRRLSPHLEKINEAIGDSRAASIHRKGAIYGDQGEEEFHLNLRKHHACSCPPAPVEASYGITLKLEVQISPRFVLGLLNSKLLDFFLKKVSTTMRGGFFRYFTQFIEKLPIVLPDFAQPADKSRHDKVVGLVDRMLLLMPKLGAATADAEKAVLQNAVTATDRQIDALVYELYQLTPEEIALVEGA